MTEHNRLKLRAASAADIQVVSALLQDGLVAASDLRYLSEEASFVMVINRYCWEQAGPAVQTDNSPQERQPEQLFNRYLNRCMCGLKVGNVSQVSQRGLSERANQFYNLLSITYEEAIINQTTGKSLIFTFSDGYAIRLAVGKLALVVQDIAEPHPGFSRPQHNDNGQF